ncbi:MAG TPA: hypothetical protein VK941_13710 [Gillisia sp.]|nr:hypothetical protein [Gillisia sp.]
MKPNIEIDIQEIIVEGFSANEARAIRKALTERLQNRFLDESQDLALFKNMEIRGLKLPALTVKHSSRPEQIGNSLADSLYTHLLKPSTTNCK